MDDNKIPDVQLKELIDSIHRDGVDKARREGEEMLRQAREKAEALVAGAQEKAEALLAGARREKEQLERSGRESLEQAGRDLVLKVRRQLEALFAALLREKSSRALEDREIVAAIAAMVSRWTPGQRQELDVLLPAGQGAALAKALRQALAAKVAQGVEIKVSPDVRDGFRVGEKDGHAYYDFSAAGIAENLSVFLNPVLSGILEAGLKQDE